MGEPAMQYPDDSSDKAHDAVEQKTRLQLAIRLFETGKLSMGKAAEVACLPKLSFMDELGKLKVPIINLEGDELEAELNALRRANRR